MDRPASGACRRRGLVTHTSQPSRPGSCFVLERQGQRSGLGMCRLARFLLRLLLALTPDWTRAVAGRGGGWGCCGWLARSEVDTWAGSDMAKRVESHAQRAELWSEQKRSGKPNWLVTPLDLDFEAAAPFGRAGGSLPLRLVVATRQCACVCALVESRPSYGTGTGALIGQAFLRCRAIVPTKIVHSREGD